ncbi:MAG TPA: RIP metalloprotease RseP [Verrucomicrobiae bacterium]|nr:RIP metalloprotease RseP [Verrucomicrobiae bacterium]
MIDILLNVWVGIKVMLLFGAAVFVHEWGHYWVARKRGMKVEAFAIGFGPKIFGWTKDGIEYSWRLIPAGGYVKLPQMVTSEAIEGSSGDKENISPAPPSSKILVAFAGPVMNVVFAVFIAWVIMMVGLPVAVNPSVIGYVEPKSEEARLGIQPSDQVVEVDGKPTKSWEDVHTITSLARTNVLPVVIERNGQRKTYQLTAKVNELVNLKLLNLDPKDHPVIFKVDGGSPAEKSGLKVNDHFLSFAEVPIYSQEQLVDLIRARGGQASEVTVERNETNKVTLQVTPMVDPATKRGRIGVGLTASAVRYEVQKPGPSPLEQLKEAGGMMYNTISALAHSKQTGVGAKDLSGPVGILGYLALQVKTDYRLALKFLVFLNINLAILNLLPMPVLDGGHILMAIIEKIRRRPLSVRFVEQTTTVFALLLISFMLYVTFFDIRRFATFRSLFKRDAQVEISEKPAAPDSPAAPAPAPAK